MDRSPSRPDDGGSDRGLFSIGGLLRGLFRLVVVSALLTAAAFAVFAGPTLVDDLGLDRDLGVDLDRDIDFDMGPLLGEEPPPAGERDPATTDPADPNDSAYGTGESAFDSEEVEELVHQGVNDRRADHDLGALEWDGTIASVSRAHSADMNERAYFAHENPDNETPFDRFGEVGSYCRAYGENIAMTVADRPVRAPASDEVVRYRTSAELADGLVEQWMNSPPHREAILSDRWDRGGVGVYLSPNGEVYATHNFCTVR